MNFSDIKELSRPELLKKRDGLRQDLFQARIKNGLGQLGNPLEIRGMRRDLARIETVLTKSKPTAAAAGKR
jgi:large subunit ribosomal protein L29